MKDSEYLTRNEPMEATFPPIILLDSPEDDHYFDNPGISESYATHRWMCDRLLSLPATHLSGPDREKVEDAKDMFGYDPVDFVATLYASREREAFLRGETWDEEGKP